MKAIALLFTAATVVGVSANTALQVPVQAQKEIRLAGNPNIGPNGTNVNSNGSSGAPGGSWGAPGQTPNPRPGK
jgi:hypothetical protein